MEHVTDEMLEAYQTQIEVGTDPYTQEPLYQTYAHYDQVRISFSEGMIAFNRGDMRKIPEVFKDFKIVDQRVQVPMKAPLKIEFPEGKDWRDYQPDAVCALAEHDFGILQSPPRSGKPVWEENLVTLGNGKKVRLKEVVVGNEVITHEGRPRKVKAVFIQGKLPCVKITTHSGRETFAALDHPYLTTSGWVLAGNLEQGMSLALVHDFSFKEEKNSFLLEEFRLAGYFIGDGFTASNKKESCSATITCADGALREDIKFCANRLGFQYTLKEPKTRTEFYTFRKVRPWLRERGLANKTAHQKRVPEWVFSASGEQVANFIGAYFACDGTISIRGKTKKGATRADACLEFYSVSKDLLKDIQYLLLRFKINTRLRYKKAKLGKKGFDSYRLTLSCQDDIVAFKDFIPLYGEKGEKIKSIAGHKRSFSSKYIADEIVSVEAVKSLPCRCLTVEEDHTFLSDDFVVHNTLIITGAICLQQQKTIVFAHQTDLLLQLHDTFEEFTNLKELRKRTGEKIVGFAETWEDFDTLDVVLCTKQTFDHIDNRRWALIMQQKFGAVWVDESHYLGGDVYSKLINRFWAYSRQGVTATVHRKDGLDAIVEGIIGPVIYKIERATVGQVQMEVTVIPTRIKASGAFAKMLTTLSENEVRNNLILGWMRKDVEAGHTIIAVTDRKQHGIDLSRALGEMGIPSVVFNGNVQDRNSRKNILDAIRSGSAKVMIGMRGMTTGLDVPRADCFYNLLPSANAVKSGEHAGEGGYEQQCTRVMTPFQGKKKALVRDFVDDFGLAYACLKQREKTYTRLGATIIREKISENNRSRVTNTAKDSVSF